VGESDGEGGSEAEYRSVDEDEAQGQVRERARG
jgi:hypothetical protein